MDGENEPQPVELLMGIIRNEYAYVLEEGAGEGASREDAGEGASR
jgi:hypothetical protein